MMGTVNVKPEHLFAGWLLFLPTFLFQTALPVRVFQTLCILAAALFSGKRLRVLPNVILFTGVTAAHLLRPAGEVVVSVLGFSVTKDALASGISRSLLLIGLVYVSRISVSSRLRLPGRGGRLLASVFFYFERITEFKHGTTWKKRRRVSLFTAFTQYMDSILFLADDLTRGEERSAEPERFSGTKRFWLFMVPFLLLNTTLLILNYLKYL